MTECERMMQSGIISEEFFREEEQNGFWVDKKRKKVWAIGIDLLLQLDQVCKRHNLKYFLMYGSLLGAIRHHGFIPWDDDIDVCMPREDYDRLMGLGSEFAEPYFLQIPGKDKGYYFSFAKLRNSNTTSISHAFRYEQFNQGIGLDIFVVDNCKPETAEEDYDRIKNLVAENSANMRRSNPNPSEEDCKRMQSFEARDPDKVYQEISEIATKYQNEKTEYGITETLICYGFKKQMFKWDDLEKLILCDFHGFQFPIPQNYDTILRTIYGDYMDFPPADSRGKWHIKSSVQPDIPYREYRLKMLQEETKGTPQSGAVYRK